MFYKLLKRAIFSASSIKNTTADKDVDANIVLIVFLTNYDTPYFAI